MLALSKRVEYALMALLYLADSANGARRSSEAIARANAIPPELMGKVLQALARAAMVASSPGPHGGYRLAKPLRDIRLDRVIEAVEGPIALVRCPRGSKPCAHYPACRIRPPLRRLHARIMRHVRGLSLDRLQSPRARRSWT